MANQFLREGSTALCEFHFDDAIQCFRQGIILSSQRVAGPALPLDENDQEASRFSFSSALMESYVPLHLDESRHISSHNIFQLFDRAICLTTAHHENAVEASIICIYNIGLTHHVRAMLLQQDQGQHGSSYHFHRANHFYQLALNAVTGASFVNENDVDADPDEPMLLVQMALLNNMGHIACHFCERTKVEACFERMYQVLPRLIKQNTSYLCHPNVVFFRSYQCCSHVLSLNLAAAA